MITCMDKILKLSVAFILLLAGAGLSSASVIYVPDDYPTIQQAIDNATAGDTIVVRYVYYENAMSKQLEMDKNEKDKHFVSITKNKLEKLSEIQKSNYTFSLHGNVNLIWSYVNDERNAEVDFCILDDVDGDGIADVLVSDCDSESKLSVLSGKNGSTIWSKNYQETWIEIDCLFDDVDGDGINDVIASLDEYNWSSNRTNLTIELLSGSNGDKLWSKKISYEGEYWIRAHGTGGDLTGDGIEDILIEAENWEQGISILHALSSKDGSKLWEKEFMGDVHGYCYTWWDLTGDGINDFAVGSYNRNDNTGELYVIRGSDGYVEWHKSFAGDTGWPNFFDDFDGDGLNDIQIDNNDAYNETGRVFVFKGTDGSLIWSKSFNHEAWMFGLSDFDGDGIEEQCLELENFTTGRVEEIQVLNGRDGSLIWKMDVNVSDVEYSKDLILLLNRTEIAENEYLYDVKAINVDGSEIWKNSFLHDIDIEIPEDAWTWIWEWGYGWEDLNGDGLTDILLYIEWDCGYWDENASTYREYSADKLILINGKDGSEIWDAECMADERIWLFTISWKDFNKDGINDVLLGTRKGVYLLTVSEMPVNQPPVAVFTYSPPHPEVGEIVTFNASTSYDPDGDIESYEWNLGDGTNASGMIVNHSYSSAGNYTVTLTVTDDDGLRASTSKQISVSEAGLPRNGDINGDGKVNLKDAIYLAKHVVGLPGYEVIYPCFGVV